MQLDGTCLHVQLTDRPRPQPLVRVVLPSTPLLILIHKSVLNIQAHLLPSRCLKQIRLLFKLNELPCVQHTAHYRQLSGERVC